MRSTAESPASMYVVSLGMSRSGLSLSETIMFITPTFLTMCIFTCTPGVSSAAALSARPSKASRRAIDTPPSTSTPMAARRRCASPPPEAVPKMRESSMSSLW